MRFIILLLSLFLIASISSLITSWIFGSSADISAPYFHLALFIVIFIFFFRLYQYLLFYEYHYYKARVDELEALADKLKAKSSNPEYTHEARVKAFRQLEEVFEKLKCYQALLEKHSRIKQLIKNFFAPYLIPKDPCSDNKLAKQN